MPTPKKGSRLGAGPAHQKLLLANLATSLFEHGRVTTTEAKARRLRPYAERLITKAKKGDLHNRRLVLRVVRDKGVIHSLFEEIAPRYAERPGGYTRITKLGPRKGDNAPMAVIELVTEEYVAKPRATRPQQPAVAAAAAAPAEEVAEAEVVETGAPAEETVETEVAEAEVVETGAPAEETVETEVAEAEVVETEAAVEEAPAETPEVAAEVTEEKKSE